MKRVWTVLALILLLFTGMYLYQPSPAPLRGELATSTPIKHLVVLVKENHAFDNYFGTFPGVEGIREGMRIPNAYGGYIAPHWLNNSWTPDLPHGREDMLEAYNGGLNDGFARVAERWGRGFGNYTPGYFDDRQIPGYWKLASRFVLADHYFQSIFGPTFPNRLYSLAGQSEGILSNVIPAAGVHIPTVLDQLEERGIPWKYYYTPYRDWLPLPLVFPHLKSDPDMRDRVVPIDQLAQDIRTGVLPAVSYVDPEADPTNSEHPPSNVTVGDAWTEAIVEKIIRGPQWASSATFITWDESGGYYDHVPPPQVDELGYGFRVPFLVVSPFAKRGWINHEVMDHTSILKFIALNWGLPYLTLRQAKANPILSSFEFGPRGAYALLADRGLGLAGQSPFRSPEPKQSVVPQAVPWVFAREEGVEALRDDTAAPELSV